MVEPISSSDKSMRRAWTYFAGMMLAYMVVIVTAHWPPGFIDYPEWVYQGVLLKHVLTGHPDALYMLKPYPVPFSLNTLFLGVASLVMPWAIAAKLYLCLYLALAPVAMWRLMRALRVRNAWAVVAAPAILFLNLEFWWGRIAFEYGMCFVMIFIAMLLEGASSWVLASLLVLTYFAHLEACACAMMFLGLWVLYKRAWKRLIVLAPTFLLVVWYVVARIRHGNVDGSDVQASPLAYGSKAFLLFRASTYFKIFGFVNLCTPGRLSQTEALVGKVGFFVLLFSCACLTLCCLVAIARGAWAWRVRAGYVTIFVLVLLGVNLFVPQIFLGSTDPGSRLVIMGASVGLLLVDWRSLVAKPLPVLSAFFCVFNLGQLIVALHRPDLPPHPLDLRQDVTTLAHIEPARQLGFYDRIEKDDMTSPIFETAMFMQNNKHPTKP